MLMYSHQVGRYSALSTLLSFNNRSKTVFMMMVHHVECLFVLYSNCVGLSEVRLAATFLGKSCSSDFPHQPPHDQTNEMTCAPSEDS